MCLIGTATPSMASTMLECATSLVCFEEINEAEVAAEKSVDENSIVRDSLTSSERQAIDTQISTRTYTPEQVLLVDRITKHLFNRRLTSPQGENALEDINSLQALQPYHDYSVNGKKYIARIYLQLAASALKNKNFDLAESNVAESLKLYDKLTAATELATDIKLARSTAVAAGSKPIASTSAASTENAATTESSTPAVVSTDAVSPEERSDEIQGAETAEAEPGSQQPAKESTPQSPPAATPTTDQTNQWLPAMVTVPAGDFTMGSETGSDDEKPVRQVSVNSFSISSYETTTEQFNAFLSDKGKELKSIDEDNRNRPVTDVNWLDAVDYVAWLSEKTGDSYRLPTETEWEYTAKAGTNTEFHTGESIKGLANCAGCGTAWDNQSTAPVGSFAPNSFGLFDIHGNVWEWVQDCWSDDYSQHGNTAVSIDKPGCDQRVIRGGAWYNEAEYARSSYRGSESPNFKDSGVGIRVAKDN